MIVIFLLLNRTYRWIGTWSQQLFPFLSWEYYLTYSSTQLLQFATSWNQVRHIMWKRMVLDLYDKTQVTNLMRRRNVNPSLPFHLPFSFAFCLVITLFWGTFAPCKLPLLHKTWPSWKKHEKFLSGNWTSWMHRSVSQNLSLSITSGQTVCLRVQYTNIDTIYVMQAMTTSENNWP